MVLPVHGEAPFFSNTIASLKEIQYQNLEIVVVLDRPSTRTEETARSFSKSDSRVTLIDSAIPGIVEALNLGISRARHSYIGRIDSDDLLSPSRLQEQMNFLQTNPDTNVLGTQLTLINSDNHEIGTSSYPTKDWQIRINLEFQNCIAHPSVLFRKDAFNLAGGYRKFFTGAEDYDLWLRMKNFGRINIINKRLTSYRISETQYTRDPSSNQELIDSAVRVNNFLEQKGISKGLPDKICEKDEIREYVQARFEEIRIQFPFEYRKLVAAKELNAIFRTKNLKNQRESILAIATLVLRHPFTISRWAILKLLTIRESTD